MNRSSLLKMTFGALLLTVPGVLVADDPPSFEEFDVHSDNKRFLAQIRVADILPHGDRDGSRQVWEVDVFDVSGKKQLVKLWSSPFNYSGYPGGLLSDDGKRLAVVSYWFDENQPMIEVYGPEGRLASILGKEIAFDRSKVENTDSHQRWLWEKPKGDVVYPYAGITGNDLWVKKIDGGETRFDLLAGRAKLP